LSNNQIVGSYFFPFGGFLAGVHIWVREEIQIVQLYSLLEEELCCQKNQPKNVSRANFCQERRMPTGVEQDIFYQ
jgi:hypothetical protein